MEQSEIQQVDQVASITYVYQTVKVYWTITYIVNLLFLTSQALY